MIAVIIREAKSAAIVERRHCDVADLFLTLAFASDETLHKICVGLRIDDVGAVRRSVQQGDKSPA